MQFGPFVKAIAPRTSAVTDYARISDQSARMPTSVEELAEAWVEEITPYAHEVVLYGHSLGALVAYEVAVRLAEQGTAVPRLVLAAARLYEHGDPALIDPDFSTEEELCRWSYQSVHGRSPSPEDREVFVHFAGRLRRELRMFARYQPRRRLTETRVLFLASIDDAVAPPDRVEQWRPFVGSLEIAMVPGPHLFHLVNPERTAGELLRWINP